MKATACRSETAAAKASFDLRGGERLDVRPSSGRFSFAFLNHRLDVETTDPHAARLLRTAYAPMLDAGFDRRAGKHIGGETAFVPRGERFETSLRAVRAAFAKFAHSAVPNGAFYGASGAFHGRAFALFGPSAIGKTTLLLHLASAGALWLGDETFVVDERGVTAAMPCLPALREPGLPLLPRHISNSVRAAPEYEDLQGGRLWFALTEKDLGGVRPSPEAYPLGAAFFLERGSAAAVTELPPEHALALLAQRLYLKPADLRGIASLRRRFRDVRSYRVALGTPAATSRLVMERLRCD